MKKNIFLCCLVVFIFMFSIACNGNVNKYKWNDAYKIVYEPALGGNDVILVVTLNEPEKNLNYYIKKIEIKFEDNNVFLKTTYWDKKVEEKEIERRYIKYIDYL